MVVIAAESGNAEAALVRAAQAGDRAAFGALYQHSERLIHGIVLSYVAYDQAEDLVQDVFVKALESIRSLRQPEAFRGWLISIARRAAADGRRRRRHTEELTDKIGARGAGNAEALDALAAIQRLPETYRETLVLRLVEGMTGPEIAAETGMTPDSVRVNLCRGMKLLRLELEVNRPV